jgi:hypothetical protein
MTDFSQLFMYIPGIIIFLVGSGQVRRWLRLHRADSCLEAEVIGCKHVVKKDKKDREVYNYYDVTVEYQNPKNKHQERLAIKSPTEYATGQQVHMYKEKGSEKPTLMEWEDEFPFHPWVTMIGGALLILLALEENRGQEIPAMICLTLLLLGAGVNLIINYISVKKRNLQAITSEIIDIYTRQISKETKILKGSKFTYYPVVRYELNGKDNIRRCNINSSNENSFKKGESLTLYYDAAKHTVYEKHARKGMLVTGIVLVAIGLLAGVSFLSVVI